MNYIPIEGEAVTMKTGKKGVVGRIRVQEDSHKPYMYNVTLEDGTEIVAVPSDFKRPDNG